MDRRTSRTLATRSKPSVVPVTNGDKYAGNDDLKSPVETISTLSTVSSPRSNASHSNLQELRFIVAGSQSCGKTSFIQRALDLKKPISSQSTSKKMSLDGQVFLINLIEIPIEDIAIINGEIQWPSKVGDIEIVRVDGVLALYDVTRKESLSRIPPLLNACKETLPCVLVSCKCDAPPKQRVFNPDEIEQMCMEETEIEGIQTSPEYLESHKRCISVVLRNYIDGQARRAKLNGVRPRAMTAASSPSPKLQAVRPKHGRATSELATSTLTSRTNIGTVQRPTLPRSDSQVPLIPESSATGQRDETFNRDNRPQLQVAGLEDPPNKPAMGSPTTIANSLIEFGGALSREDSESSNKSSLESEEPPPASGWTFEELVERLLAQPVSRVDHKFNATFLCLYRKFAAPAELFAAILQSFEKVQKSETAQLLKLDSQLRHLAIMEQWLGAYPGDFAHPFLHDLVTNFVKKISGNRIFAIAAHEMAAHLESVMEDDDTNWAASDSQRGRNSIVKSLARVPSLSSSMSSMLSESNLFGDAWTKPKRKDANHSKTPSSVSSLERKPSASASSAAMLINSVEMAQRQADSLLRTNRISLTKVQWRQFMDISENDHAKELTRIDRILYSAIRPRDLIRHVSLTTDEREHCRGLEYVTQMIDQFNHVAFWVTNMLLLRDKAKHRARALEKFMKIARKLRQANNYNGLGAILAGINSTSAHRLMQTRELVPGSASKEFMRLEILMGSSRSHFAYRLAWENTTGERIPFLPLHRRDLVSAEEGNKTFFNDNEERINWRKFEIMGDVITGIQDSQGPGFHHQQRNAEIQRLILETKIMKDEDELYERSCYLEPPRANESRRRFNWFQR